jgi:type I restriction enzyme S subunit
VSREFDVGTVLVAIVGATIGNTGILTFQACFPDSLVGISCREHVTPQYVELVLRTLKYELRTTAYASGGQPNINIPVLQRVIVPVPPVQEQEQIVADVERCLSVVDKLAATVSANLKRVERLRQSILERAFSGQLVPQDANDEPASVLLARMRATPTDAANGRAPTRGNGPGPASSPRAAQVAAVPPAAQQGRLWDADGQKERA